MCSQNVSAVHSVAPAAGSHPEMALVALHVPVTLPLSPNNAHIHYEARLFIHTLKCEGTAHLTNPAPM